MSINLPSRKLVSQDDAAMVQRPDVPRSKFSGSFSRLTTFDAGLLVPILVDEVLPGDHMKYDVTAYLRMSTPLFPMMSNQRVDTFFFFVPNRLVWANWRQFMGQQANPGSSIDFTIPQVVSAAGGFPVHGLFDHFGLPTVGQVDGSSTISVSALPSRAYALIYNEWFRDQNLQNSRTFSNSNGPDTVSSYDPLARRGKSHDYFTSCLPWPQKFTAPTVALAGFAPVFGIGGSNAPGGVVSPVNEYPGGTSVYANAWTASTGNFAIQASDGTSTAYPLVTASLADGAAFFDINTFREAFLIQQMLERDARGGTRYTELVKMHFGVTSPDARLQRPEYIGGGSSPLNITPIAQTAPSTGQAVGWLGGAGTSVGSHRASYAATEHGYVIGLINVRSELAYQQGIPRHFSRSTRYDFYWPSLSGLGEQAVLRKEIYATGLSSDDDVFGYQERWHEYRTRYSEVTGMFRSTTSGTIDQWHIAERFNTAPTLGATFIVDNPPMSRVLAGDVVANMQYLADINIRREAVRPIPQFGTPATLGRF